MAAARRRLVILLLLCSKVRRWVRNATVKKFDSDSDLIRNEETWVKKSSRGFLRSIFLCLPDGFPGKSRPSTLAF